MDGSKISVSAESRFDAERDLHQAIAAHPEVLPSEDLGLGPLIALGTELDVGDSVVDRELGVVALHPRLACVRTTRES